MTKIYQHNITYMLMFILVLPYCLKQKKRLLSYHLQLRSGIVHSLPYMKYLLKWLLRMIHLGLYFILSHTGTIFTYMFLNPVPHYLWLIFGREYWRVLLDSVLRYTICWKYDNIYSLETKQIFLFSSKHQQFVYPFLLTNPLTWQNGCSQYPLWLTHTGHLYIVQSLVGSFHTQVLSTNKWWPISDID